MLKGHIQQDNDVLSNSRRLTDKMSFSLFEREIYAKGWVLA